MLAAHAGPAELDIGRLLAGCAQRVLDPDINTATIEVLVRNGVRLCFTCAVEAGKAAMTATGFARPVRGGSKDP